MAGETSSRIGLSWPASWRPVQRVASRETTPLPFHWRACVRTRVLVCAALLGTWTVAIEGRLVYLQVYRYADLRAQADRQQLRRIPLPAKRGDILDRNGHPLAYSVDMITVGADPSQIEDPAAIAAAICRVVRGCDAQRQAAMAERLAQKKKERTQFTYLDPELLRRITPEDAQPIRDLDIKGLVFLSRSSRYYPNNELASAVLGFVNIDNEGLAGIEKGYDSRIRGKQGATLVQVDERRRAVETRQQTPALAGESLELTIDKFLQHVAEQELRAGVEENRAASGRVVIMAPYTGQVLAMATYPTYNPNEPAAVDGKRRQNPAVEEPYEPGSTFKIVTASAAFQEGVARPTDLVDCSPGYITFGYRRIQDVHRYGVMPLTDVIVKSSNVGAIKVGQKVGPERLVRYIKRFGFGQKLAPDFPGQTAGVVWSPEQLNPSALASVSMGYQVSVTPLQMAMAVSAIANGGELIQPRIVRALIKNGTRTEVARKVLGRPIEPDTAAELTSIMEQVVERGTATAAQIPGYTIAGKTGTASRVVNGAYSNTEYHASFVGFAPSRNPAFTIVVVIDSPHGNHGYYGGQVAAPVFKRIAERALLAAGIPPTLNPLPPVIVARSDAAGAGAKAAAVSAAGLPRPVLPPGLAPDVRGLSAREALRILTQAGLAVSHLEGDGFVVEQEPPAGSEMSRGDTCALKLSRRPPASTSGGPQQ